MKFKYLVLIFVFSFFKNFGQENFPQGYFIMPIAPGQTTSLSGCFGDIRINHFHAGLDIRTGGAEGKNVYAAASGYVSRIKIMTGGYGNALYVTHPNGYTTVYAHLKVLNDTLQNYLVKKQYEAQKWDIDISPQPNEFPVNQGEIIALSGNTGGSAGPHLHFEIRDQAENILDPSQFGFEELGDYIPPVIEFVTLKCMSTDARINGQFGAFNFAVVRGKNGLYTLPMKILAKGELALEILTYDKSHNSPFRQGINQINLNVNQKQVYNFRIDKMAFDNKLDMNVHVNYEKLIKKGQKIHKCYIETGNSLKLYKTNETNGIFKIENGDNQVDFRVNDAFSNTIALKFNIIYDSLNVSKNIIPQPGIVVIKPTLIDNFLKIEINDPNNVLTNLKIIKNNSESYIPLTSINILQKIIVLDLKNGWPGDLFLNERKIELPVNYYLSPETPKLSLPNTAIDFSGVLYGPQLVNITSSDAELKLHADVIPLKGLGKITWQKQYTIAYPDKFKVYLKDKKPKFIGGDWQGNQVTFFAKEYGTYQTLYDLDPPSITIRTISQDVLKFKVSDSMSGIKDIKCMVNGEWVLMNYEYKSGLIWSEKIDKAKPFEGNVVLTVTDNCNNINTFEVLISTL
jgi:murein DD-endopeptidase MepM/ murein hydrolase activator NlpD